MLKAARLSPRLKLPIRIDFIGGWTDQICWEGPAAVCNGSFDCELPANILETPGTGLGISSILAAAEWIGDDPDRLNDHHGYTEAALAFEASTGVLGGWQDAVGAIAPGLKLVTRGPFYERRDEHPILYRLVLFDTGIRRNSGEIGNRVRTLAETSQEFRDHLELVSKHARDFFNAKTAEEAAMLSLAAWVRFCRFVPQMEPRAMPFQAHDVIGWKMCGAGGGGFGVAFCQEPEARQRTVDHLEDWGIWSAIPTLAMGAQFE